MRESWVSVDGALLHVLSEGSADSRPMVFIAGGLGTADVFLPTMQALTPRPCFAITKRGNGKSDKPLTGYGLDAQSEDLAKAIRELTPKSVILLAYSAAVPSAILAAGRNPGLVAGLILCDYPAIYPEIPQSYIEAVVGSSDYDSKDCPKEVLEAIVRESERRELWDLLPGLSFPVLVAYGKGEGSYMNAERLDKYADALPDGRAIGFEGAGHGFIETHFEPFIAAVRSFLSEFDENGAAT